MKRSYANSKLRNFSEFSSTLPAQLRLKSIIAAFDFGTQGNLALKFNSSSFL